MKIEEKVENAISKNIENLGFEIEYVEYVKEPTGYILRVVLDKKDGSVSLDGCENVSRNIEDIVDKNIKGEYVLEVSSPGLERNLKNIKLYKKYIGYNIYVKLYKKLEDKNLKKEITGILEKVDEDNNCIFLKVDNVDNLIQIELKNISNAHTIYDFDFKN